MAKKGGTQPIYHLIGLAGVVVAGYFMLTEILGLKKPPGI
jgi:hypothetical protein